VEKGKRADPEKGCSNTVKPWLAAETDDPCRAGFQAGGRTISSIEAGNVVHGDSKAESPDWGKSSMKSVKRRIKSRCRQPAAGRRKAGVRKDRRGACWVGPPARPRKRTGEAGPRDARQVLGGKGKRHGKERQGWGTACGAGRGPSGTYSGVVAVERGIKKSRVPKKRRGAIPLW